MEGIYWSELAAIVDILPWAGGICCAALGCTVALFSGARRKGGR